MRYVRGFASDRLIGKIDDGPPLKSGDIIRLLGRNYKVVGGCDNRKIPEVYVNKSTVSQFTTPDYRLEVV